jgi:hypothetical protein
MSRGECLNKIDHDKGWLAAIGPAGHVTDAHYTNYAKSVTGAFAAPAFRQVETAGRYGKPVHLEFSICGRKRGLPPA